VREVEARVVRLCEPLVGEGDETEVLGILVSAAVVHRVALLDLPQTLLRAVFGDELRAQLDALSVVTGLLVGVRGVQGRFGRPVVARVSGEDLLVGARGITPGFGPGICSAAREREEPGARLDVERLDRELVVRRGVSVGSRQRADEEGDHTRHRLREVLHDEPLRGYARARARQSRDRATPRPMSTLRRVAPVLPVRDVARALAHYRALGFKADAHDESGPDGPIYGFLSSGSVELHLARVATLDPKTNTSACYLDVDDADAIYSAWTSAGVEGRFIAPIRRMASAS
jgi:hypothetical protein